MRLLSSAPTRPPSSLTYDMNYRILQVYLNIVRTDHLICLNACHVSGGRMLVTKKTFLFVFFLVSLENFFLKLSIFHFYLSGL